MTWKMAFSNISMVQFSVLLTCLVFVKVASSAACNNLTISTTPSAAEVGKSFEIDCQTKQDDDRNITFLGWYFAGKVLPSNISIDNNHGSVNMTATYVITKVKQSDQHFTCRAEFSDGLFCEAFHQTLVKYQPEGPLICSTNNISTPSHKPSAPSTVELICHIDDAGEPLVYPQMSKICQDGQTDLQQRAISVDRGRGFKVVVTYEEFIHCRFTCETSEDSFFKERHIKHICNFTFSGSQISIDMSASQLDVCQSKASACRDQLSDCQNHASANQVELNNLTHQLLIDCQNVVSAYQVKIKDLMYTISKYKAFWFLFILFVIMVFGLLLVFIRLCQNNINIIRLLKHGKIDENVPKSTANGDQNGKANQPARKENGEEQQPQRR